jgi:Ca2+-binding RTX toxin-like protein
VIVSGAGNDVIRGGGASDDICAGPGDDVVSGGIGRDTIAGGTGDDVLRGGQDQDTFVADPGNDVIIGYPRHGVRGPRRALGDVVTWNLPVTEPLTAAAVSADLARGAADSADTGHDRLIHIESLVGGLGNDYFAGNRLRNHLQGGLGSNTLIGRGGPDVIDSGIEDPGTGGGTLRGGPGNDAIDDNGGAFTILGGRGRDVLSANGNARSQIVALRGVP